MLYYGSTDDGRKKLSIQLMKFYNFGKLNHRLPKLCENKQISVEDIFHTNAAKYHPNCYSSYNDRSVNREKRKLDSEVDQTTNDTPGPSKQSSFENDAFQLGKLVCCFCQNDDKDYKLCAAGTMHSPDVKVKSSHVLQLTSEWKKMASFLGQTDVLIRLSSGDVTSNELYYHKNCYVNSRNIYFRKRAEEHIDIDTHEALIKAVSQTKVIEFLYETESNCPGEIIGG